MKTHLFGSVLIGAMVALSVACGGSTYDPRMGGGSNDETADAGNTADASTTDNAGGDAGTVAVDPTPTTQCGVGTHHEMVGSLDTCVVNAVVTPDPVDTTPVNKEYCLDRDADGAVDCNACVTSPALPGPFYKEKTSGTACDSNDVPTATSVDAGTPVADAGTITADAGTPPVVETVCGTGTILVGNTCEVAPPPATDGGTTTDAGTTTTVDAGTTDTTADAGTTTTDAGTTTITCPAGQHLNNGACVNDAPPSGPCTFTVSVPASYDNLRATFSLDPSGQVSGWPCRTSGSVLTCTAPAVGTTVYVQANLTAGNHWLCDGFSDAGDTASHLTTSVTITGCGYTNVTPYHKPSAINTDGCAGRAIPATP